MVLVGLGLMLGLLTRLSALGAAVYLLLFYLSMPPWPGLPPAPVAEGHYFIVSKNLIEMLACLALTFLPTGRWIGLDALLFNWIGRARHRDEESDDEEQDRARRRRNRTVAQHKSY